MIMLEKELYTAIDAAKEAGTILKHNKEIIVDALKGRDVKLKSDCESEKTIISRLSSFDYPILSEECGVLSGKGRYRWIIDPLDGTMNYYKGLKDISCVSIALWENNEPVIGVIYQFMKDILFWGVVGDGAYKNEEEIHTSNILSTEQAVLATGFPLNSKYDDEHITKSLRNVKYFKKIRMLGSAAIMGAYVSSGVFDAYMEDDIMLWDIAASTALVVAAGGEKDVYIKKNNKCKCNLFCNKSLKEDYYAKSL